MTNKKLFLAGLAVLAGGSLLGGVAIGPVYIPPELSLSLIWSWSWDRDWDWGAPQPDAGGGLDPELARLIVHEVRLPRVLLGFLVGGALALCGGVMQGLFRNPLASPYVLGIASGASAGAALVIALGWSGPAALPLGAFLGGALAVALVYRLSQRGGRTSPLSLILAGIALGAIFSALTSLLIFLSAGDRRLSEIVFWLMGSLGRASWPYLWVMAPVVLLGSAAIFASSRELNALALGEEGARHLGLEPERLKRLLLGLCTLLVGAAVAFAGTIGFIGLIIPHLVRLVLGPDHRALLPAAALAGGVLLVWADALARTALRPAELPVGIITALVGAPFFLYLLRARASTSTSMGTSTRGELG